MHNRAYLWVVGDLNMVWCLHEPVYRCVPSTCTSVTLVYPCPMVSIRPCYGSSNTMNDFGCAIETKTRRKHVTWSECLWVDGSGWWWTDEDTGHSAEGPNMKWFCEQWTTEKDLHVVLPYNLKPWTPLIFYCLIRVNGFRFQCCKNNLYKQKCPIRQ